MSIPSQSILYYTAAMFSLWNTILLTTCSHLKTLSNFPLSEEKCTIAGLHLQIFTFGHPDFAIMFPIVFPFTMIRVNRLTSLHLKNLIHLLIRFNTPGISLVTFFYEVITTPCFKAILKQMSSERDAFPDAMRSFLRNYSVLFIEYTTFSLLSWSFIHFLFLPQN